MSAYALHWFRRDLRLTGNPALLHAARKYGGRVLGVFFFDYQFLSRPDFSHTRFAFFMDTLAELQTELRASGGDLLVLDAQPDAGFKELIGALGRSKAGKPSEVTFNRDYEPFARDRDARIVSLLETELGVATHTERDHLLIEPREIFKDADPASYYQVYTPFSRKWFAALATPEVRARVDASLASPGPFRLTWEGLLAKGDTFADRLEKFRTENAKRVKIPIPKAGAAAAARCLAAFRPKLEDYGTERDFPAVKGTSQLSIFLKNGSVTVAQILATLGLHRAGIGKGSQESSQETSKERFVKELCWREFYYHILWHCPWVEHEAFLPKYRALKWENRDDLFQAWVEGRTGYPIVDAGMRQLAQTGWMHNRVRMIVASFLVKDLLVDWRWGERVFMERLLDGDLAPNNGGWQWAASTGCDPQPYFRIFNPLLQSKKFDPDGVYLKRWLPERAHLSGDSIHEPIDPIVDHAERKSRAVALFKE